VCAQVQLEAGVVSLLFALTAWSYLAKGLLRAGGVVKNQV